MTDVDRPAPGEELHDGEVAPARPAATVMVVRGGERALEVLLVQRNPEQRFMGGAWVFPGGAVDPHDGDPQSDAAQRASALRELREEAGLELPGGPEALVRYSRWITPAQIRRRFDTHFFLAEAPPGAVARVDGRECVAARWIAPTDALAAHRAGTLELVFPTIRHLLELEGHGSAAAALRAAAQRRVEPVEPRVVVEGGVARVLLPGELGYGDGG